MDCVGCEKCRLWGKLQVLGLGTALKILFSVNGEEHLSQTVSITSYGRFETSHSNFFFFMYNHVLNTAPTL